MKKISWMALVLLAGCTPNTEDVVYTNQIAYPGTNQIEGYVFDAKTRNVWATKLPVRVISQSGSGTTYDYKIERRQVLCSEPSPDALSALSASLAGKLSVALKNVEVGAGFQKSFQETVEALVKRTENIQLLRDGFFRACEAYSNGALSSFGYSLILNNIDEIMIQLVALNSAGGGARLTDAENDLLKAEADQKTAVHAAAATKANRVAAYNTKNHEVAALDKVIKDEKNRSGEATELKAALDKQIATLASEIENLKEPANLATKLLKEAEKTELEKQAREAERKNSAADEKVKQLTADRDALNTKKNEANGAVDTALKDENVNVATATKKATEANHKRSQKSTSALQQILKLKAERGPRNLVDACLSWLSLNLDISTTDVTQSGNTPALVVHCNNFIAKSLEASTNAGGSTASR
jgi:hypothetical protein